MKMKRIWKYDVPVGDDEIVRSIPAGAQILAVQMQRGTPMLWALVDPHPPTYEDRRFRWYGTGHTMPDDPGQHCGTIQDYDGHLIFHLFEVQP